MNSIKEKLADKIYTNAYAVLVLFKFQQYVSVLSTSHYYTIIDFNEVDIRIYLPEKVIIHRGR